MPALEEQFNVEQLSFLHAYVECSDSIQEGVREMLRITFSSESTEEERNMATATVAEALFPSPHKGQVGMDLEELQNETPDHVPELRPIVEKLDQEEANFSRRLKGIMAVQGINQCDLAAKIGVTQPAISLMLNRNCRPLRTTIVRLAEALNVPQGDLWQDELDE